MQWRPAPGTIHRPQRLQDLVRSNPFPPQRTGQPGECVVPFAAVDLRRQLEGRSLFLVGLLENPRRQGRQLAARLNHPVVERAARMPRWRCQNICALGLDLNTVAYPPAPQPTGRAGEVQVNPARGADRRCGWQVAAFLGQALEDLRIIGVEDNQAGGRAAGDAHIRRGPPGPPPLDGFAVRGCRVHATCDKRLLATRPHREHAPATGGILQSRLKESRCLRRSASASTAARGSKRPSGVTTARSRPARTSCLTRSALICSTRAACVGVSQLLWSISSRTHITSTRSLQVRQPAGQTLRWTKRWMRAVRVRWCQVSKDQLRQVVRGLEDGSWRVLQFVTDGLDLPASAVVLAPAEEAAAYERACYDLLVSMGGKVVHVDDQGRQPGPVPCASRRIASKPDAKPDETGRVRFPGRPGPKPGRKPGQTRSRPGFLAWPGLPTLRVGRPDPGPRPARRARNWVKLGQTQFPGRVALVASGRVPWWCTTTAEGRWPGCGSGCRPAPSGWQEPGRRWRRVTPLDTT
jgi:hypothetical protein